jgi:Glucose inhibited division protein A
VSAVVVGAGVSGCACAATLASRGVRVTLVNSALDSVGQPGYGPVVMGRAGGWSEIRSVLERLPAPLRDAWLSASVAPCDGGPLFCADGRMLSIETKRALESVPGLEFRQGLVNDVKLQPDGDEAPRAGREGSPCVAVETVFGERIETAALIVAVGLGLGGRVSVGSDTLPGGRYGETAAEGLFAALQRLGAIYREAVITVGPRYLRGGFGGAGMGEIAATVCDGIDSGDRRRVDGVRSLANVLWNGAEGPQPWPAEYPPSPHWTEGLAAREVVLGKTHEGEMGVVLAPDGVATGEVYLVSRGVTGANRHRAESGGTKHEGHLMASRLEHETRGVMVTNLGPGGRLISDGDGPLPVWVTGRAGGAEGYLESLAAGVRTAVDVAAALDGHGPGGGSGGERVTTDGAGQPGIEGEVHCGQTRSIRNGQER